MKIPRIQEPQQSFVAGSGARPLSARVNPGAMAAPGQALAQLGNTLQDITSTWLNTELTIRNQQEVAKAKSYMATKVDEATQAVKTIADPKKAEAEYTRLVKVAQNAVNKGGVEGLSFTTGSARRTWQAEASTLVSNGAKTVRTTARTLMAETAVADAYSSLDKIARDRASATSQSDQKRYEGDITFVVQMLQGMGHIDPKQAYALQQKYLGKSDQLLVEKQLLGAEENDDPEIAEDVFGNLQDVEQYQNLSNEARQDLSERALRLADRLERKKQADDDRADRKNAAAITKRQNKTYATFLAQISEYKQDPEKNPELPSQSQILASFKAGDLRPEQQEKLFTELRTSNEPLVVDQRIVQDYRQQIRAASGPDDLDDIIDDAYKDSRLDGQTIQALEAHAEGAKKRTPEFRAYKRYADVLDQLGTPQGIIDKLLPGAKERFAIIKAQYEAAVDEGVDPTTAFNDAMEAIQANRRINEKALVPPRVGKKAGTPIDQWTLDDVAEAVEAARTAYKGRISSLTIELLNLKGLQTYIQSKMDEDKAKVDATNNPSTQPDFKVVR